MAKSKLSALLSVLVVFVSGIAMGAVGYRLYSVKSVVTAPPNASARKGKQPQMTPEEFRKRVVARLSDVVKLDPEQKIQVEKIYDEQGAEFDKLNAKYGAEIDRIHQAAAHERDQIHDRYVPTIRAMLRPDQQALYDKWIADRAAARARKQQERKDHPDGRQRPPLP